MKTDYKLFQPVKLNFSEEDFEDLDFGASGHVLKAPASRFKTRINETFKFMGDIPALNGMCAIQSKYGNQYIISYNYLRDDDDYEYVEDIGWRDKLSWNLF